MNLNNLKHIRKCLSIDLQDKSNYDTPEYTKLCHITGEIDLLIKMVEKKNG